jgi:hypothetical protein
MGEIVAAFATCHAPQLFTYPPDEDPAQLDASIAGMRELGKLLDETRPDVILMRHDAALRRRLLTDLDGVTREYQLREDCHDAARALAEVGATARISDNAGRIVAAGAHPLHVLMTLHAVHGEMKRPQRELSGQS